ncbi:ricin-type beta-trefoil lectin domain protein [Streptomyces tendae]|uniref:ricin-type beta-trefoil lectin domain protein n=1 Tax=Streptomyces tendae TaxID=1932 RepID=UPI003D735B19
MLGLTPAPAQPSSGSEEAAATDEESEEAAGPDEPAQVRESEEEEEAGGAQPETAAGTDEAQAQTEGDAGEARAEAVPTAATLASDRADAAAATVRTRPHKSLLAGASIAGALMLAVPLLISAQGDGPDRSAGSRPAAGTALEGEEQLLSTPGAFETASSSAHPTRKPVRASGPSTAQPPRSAGTKDKAPVGAAPDPTTAVPSPAKKTKSQEKPDGTPRPHPPASPAKSPGPTAVVKLRSQSSGRCIDVLDGKRTNGTPLQIWNCEGQAWQQWEIWPDGTMRTMGKCMTLLGGHDNATPIALYDCNGNATQQFRVNAANDLVNPYADKCVDVKDQRTTNGTRLQLWTCNGQANQKWSTS